MPHALSLLTGLKRGLIQRLQQLYESAKSARYDLTTKSKHAQLHKRKHNIIKVQNLSEADRVVDFGKQV